MSIVPFSFEDNEIRFFPENNTFEIVASDVLKVLHPEADKRNYGNYLGKVKDKYKGHKKIMTLGGEQEVVTLKEPGFYQLVSNSKSPKAEPFQEWLYEDVIPSIRKTGKYEVSQIEQRLPLSIEEAKATHMIEFAQKQLDYWTLRSNVRMMAMFETVISQYTTVYLLPGGVVQPTVGGQPVQVTGNVQYEGVIDIAIRLGYKVPRNYESALGVYASKRVGNLKISVDGNTLKDRRNSAASNKEVPANMYPAYNKEVEAVVVEYCEKRGFLHAVQ